MANILRRKQSDIVLAGAIVAIVALSPQAIAVAKALVGKAAQKV